MASITFVDESTVIPASWLNDADAWLYEGIPGAAFTALDISGAAQGQIKFPATKNASAGANTLDDYQESSYTGTATGMTTSPTCAGSCLAASPCNDPYTTPPHGASTYRA